jgi:hypothetical protein
LISPTSDTFDNRVRDSSTSTPNPPPNLGCRRSDDTAHKRTSRDERPVPSWSEFPTRALGLAGFRMSWSLQPRTSGLTQVASRAENSDLADDAVLSSVDRWARPHTARPSALDSTRTNGLPLSARIAALRIRSDPSQGAPFSPSKQPLQSLKLLNAAPPRRTSPHRNVLPRDQARTVCQRSG